MLRLLMFSVYMTGNLHKSPLQNHNFYCSFLVANWKMKIESFYFVYHILQLIHIKIYYI